MERNRFPDNHYYDSDAEDREQRYPRWRKIVSAHCNMKNHRAPWTHTRDDWILHELGNRPAVSASVSGSQDAADKYDARAKQVSDAYNSSNAYLYSFLCLAVKGQQLDTIILSDAVPESDGREALAAMDKKNQGKAIVDVLKTAQRLFATPYDETLTKPEVIATHITKLCALLKSSTYAIGGGRRWWHA